MQQQIAVAETFAIKSRIGESPRRFETSPRYDRVALFFETNKKQQVCQQAGYQAEFCMEFLF